MGVLHLRGFNDDLQRRVRATAAQHGTTMKAVVEEAVRRELNRLEREGLDGSER